MQNGEYKYYISFYDGKKNYQLQEASQIIFLHFFGKHKMKVKGNIKHYYISYKDICEYELPLCEYKLFSSFDSQIMRINNINSRYIEQFELSDIKLHKRLLQKEASISEIVYTKVITEKLFEAIISLGELQRRRLIMYYFENMTYEEIGNIEHCTKVSVKFSIDLAIINIRKSLKNYVIIK